MFLTLMYRLHLIQKGLEQAKVVHDYIVSLNCMDTV